MARAALPRGLNAYSGVGELERIEIRCFRQSMDRCRVALERRQAEWTTAVNGTGEAKQGGTAPCSAIADARRSSAVRMRLLPPLSFAAWRGRTWASCNRERVLTTGRRRSIEQDRRGISVPHRMFDPTGAHLRRHWSSARDHISCNTVDEPAFVARQDLMDHSNGHIVHAAGLCNQGYR